VRNRRPKECKFFYVNPVLVRRHFTVSAWRSVHMKVKQRENEIDPLVRYQGFAFLDLDSIENC
jgi:hypothetical protein